MKQSIWAGALMLATVACQEPSPSLRGTLNLAAVGRTSSTLVAIDDRGGTRESEVGRGGEVEVEIERERAYTFAFEDEGRRFAMLVFRDGETTKSVVRVRDDLAIDVGTIEPVATDSEDCRETADPVPDPAGDPTPAGEIMLFTSMRVAGDNDVSSEDPSDQTFSDSDDDGIADALDDDDDNDGICDGEDETFDDDPSNGGDDPSNEEGEAELPYAVELDVGDVFVLIDAFEKVVPRAIVDVEMEGGDWRLAELAGGVPFEVTQADCDHEGNRDTGRDRIFVSWTNPNGSREIDHLDLRYCGN